MQRDFQLAGNGFAFRNQIIEESASWFKTCCSAVMKRRECSDGIGRGVKNWLGPLRAARIFQGNRIHAGARHQRSELFNFLHRCVRWLKWANPSVTFDVVSDVTRRNWMTRRKSRSANHVFNVLGNNLFVPYAVLHGAHSTALIENMSRLGDGTGSVDSLGRDDAVIAVL